MMMTKTLSFLTASVLVAGVALGPVQAQDAPAQQEGSKVEALIFAQLQIDGSVDGATAADIAARVVDALADQGYRVVDVGQTFLGRLRIVAESAVDRREVIVSRTTGAVMRDRITATFEVGVSGSATAAGSTAGTAIGDVNGGITGGLNGGVGIDAGGNFGIGGSSGSTDVETEGSVGGSVSVGLGG